MPHPDMKIVDIPLRLDQVAFLMRLIDEGVATGRADVEVAAGPYAALLYEIPADHPTFRPGTQHWIWKAMKR